MNKKRLISMLAMLAILVPAFAPAGRVSYAATRTFPETGKTVSDTFLDYWNTHGGLAQQGYPISEEMDEVNDTDGQTYTVQYFERAVFEKHPENAEPYDVLLSLLGTTLYNNKYKGNAPGQTASKTNARTFSETGKTLGGVFRKYWEQHGALAQQGYPISNEFKEKSDTDGQTYTVQYFERAVFEYHPENAGKPSEVLLSLLGRFRYDQKYGAGGGTPPASSDFLVNVAGWTHIAVATNNVGIFYNATNGEGIAARINKDGSITPLQKYPDESAGNAGLEKGWTTVEAGPNNMIVFYAESTGAFGLLKVDEDGRSTWLEESNSGKGYSDISINPLTGIMFWQDKTKQQTAVTRLNSDGTFNNIKAQSTDITGIYDDYVMATGQNGIWFDYISGAGLLNTYRMNSAGDFIVLESFNVYGKGVSHIVSDYNGHVVFYSRSGGTLRTGSVTASGGVPLLKEYSGVGTGWKVVTSSLNNIIIFYDGTGYIATDKVESDGTETALQRYVPAK